MFCTRSISCAALALSLLCAPASAPADAMFEGLEIPMNGELFQDLTGDEQDADDTSVRILNLSEEGGAVSLVWDPVLGLQQGESVAEGFQLLDGTLEVVGSLPQGELRARYQIEYDPRAVRAARIRAGTLRVMRFDTVRSRWLPAVQQIEGPRADIRFLPRRAADFVLGHHGFDDELETAWAVVDVTSRYAVGGMLLPEPGALLLMASGVALLVWRRPRRS